MTRNLHLSTGLRLAADGKAPRGSREQSSGQAALQKVTACAKQTGVAPAQANLRSQWVGSNG
ncbi:MAG: hypothetical protein NZM18_11150 [Thermoflexales bacterium]|nr:hypothetical protein [Thermoflexales bacterium]